MGAKYRKGSLLPQPPLSSVGSGTGENRCCAWPLQAARQPPLLRDPYLHLPPLPSGSERARIYWGQEVTMATSHSLGSGWWGGGCLAVEGRLGTHARPDLVVWSLCPGHIGWRFSVRATCREGCPAGDGGEADSIVHVEAHHFSGTRAACLPRTPRMDESVPARWGLSR